MQLVINGESVEVDVDPATPLLWVIRDHLGLVGTKFGCGKALCGACTVHLGDVAIRSCVTPVAAATLPITTIEGLSDGDALHPVQQAWVEHRVPQCGYCQGGQIMSAVALLKANPSATDEQIDAGMSGNLCRCGTYTRIRAAIRSVRDAAPTPEATPDATEEAP